MTHDHSHAHTELGIHDWAAMAAELESEADTYLPYVIGALDDFDARRCGPAPSRILDVGAGPGVFTAELARRYPDAEVIAVDGSPELLELARDRAARAGLTIETLRTDLPGGFASLPTADLIWSAQTLHHIGDQAAAVAALAGRLAHGGVLAVAEGGLPTRFLPRDIGIGIPALQDRLEAQMAEGFAAMRAELDGTVDVPEDWPALLRAAGLSGVRARTFLVDRPAPLEDGPRRTVARLLSRYLRLRERLSPQDAATLERLTHAEDPASVLHRDDVFVLAARTVYTGIAE
ncbi:class I SAM-dependent methyltransferase [Tsukamurella paurometabola]|nr:class I SAM-dependent methyltransferase [Tsukamurella paurometabola]